MRMVVQRVSKASVLVDGETVGAIQRGLLLLVGIARADTMADAEYLAGKALGLRIFPGEDRRMNRSVAEVGGGILVVSQFTLYGDVRKGRRPAFDRAAPPDLAKEIYNHLLSCLRARHSPVESGIFQAMMQINLVNDGPVTILCDSERLL
jgi:D-tyrosyl-tRNA(Tyr) deacylase